MPTATARRPAARRGHHPSVACVAGRWTWLCSCGAGSRAHLTPTWHDVVTAALVHGHTQPGE